MQQKVTAQIGATPISIETGKIARLADGSEQPVGRLYSDRVRSIAGR